MQCYLCKCELEIGYPYKSCAVCRQKKRIEQNARYHEKHPNAKPNSRTRNRKLSFDETLAIIADYNRRHGTNLSYGQYMAKFGRRSG